MLFGPAPMALLGLLVLLFQAILLAHGGLTTLGANTFSMAIAGPIVSYGLFKLCRKLNVNRLMAVGLAAGIGDLFTYCVTAGQLALAHPGEAGVMASMGEFLGIFAVTQIPLAIVEGIIAAIVMMMLESFAKPELREIGYLAKEGNKIMDKKRVTILILVILCAVILIFPLMTVKDSKFGGGGPAAGRENLSHDHGTV